MRKKLLLVFYILIAFVVLCSNVYATINPEISLTKDKEKVKAGEEVIISLNLRNISSNITGVTGFIDVDESVLNPFSEDMIVRNSNGKVEVTSGNNTQELSFSYNPQTPDDVGEALFNTNSQATEGHDVFFYEEFKGTGLSSDSVILKLKATVKSGISDGDLARAIQVVDLVAGSTDTTTGQKDKSGKLSADVTIRVDNAVPVPPTPANNSQEENTNQNQNQNTNTNQNQNQNQNQNTNTNQNRNQNQNTNTNQNQNQNKNTNTNQNKNQNTNTNNNKNVNTNKNTDNTVAGNKL